MSSTNPNRGAPSKNVKIVGVTAAVVALVATLTACSSSKAATTTSTAKTAAGSATTTVLIGAHSNGAAKPLTVSVSAVSSIRAELPAATIRSGKLVIGLGALPSSDPPLAFLGDDQKTLTGSEPDLGRLVAAVLGLKPEVVNATWDNLFVGIDSGRTDVGFSNITDTEQRKLKYDFASYRDDNLAFLTEKTATWTFDKNPDVLAGKTISVDSGTNQEKILLAFKAALKAKGKSLTIKYFPNQASTYLALSSGKIDGYFAPNPSLAYHVTQTATSPNPTRIAGEYSGAGATLQGLIAATTKKNNGLIKPIHDAIDLLIKNGDYARWLAAYNLSREAVPTSQINPPGLPTTNS